MPAKKGRKRTWHRRWKDGWLAHPDPGVTRRGALIDSFVFDHGALRRLLAQPPCRSTPTSGAATSPIRR